MRFLWFLLSISCFGQSFYGGGVSLLPQTSPKPTGWAAAVVTANAKQKLYSISETDFTVVRAATGIGFTVQTSVRTGGALWLRQFGKANIYAVLDGGMATTGTNSSGAVASGGMVLFPTKWPRVQGLAGVRVLKTALGAAQTLIEFGFLVGAK
jgi:hypothetical protein